MQKNEDWHSSIFAIFQRRSKSELLVGISTTETGGTRKVWRAEDENMCPLCDTTFQDSLSLFYHQLANKHFTLYCCLCQRCYSSNDKMKRHVESVHSKNAGFKCWMCDKMYCRSDVLVTHQMSVHGLVTCRRCNATFRSKDMLKAHMQEWHQRWNARNQWLVDLIQLSNGHDIDENLS